MQNPLRALLPEDFEPAPPVQHRRTARASDDALTGTTRMWLKRLPSSRRPLRLCELYPRVANRLAWCWGDLPIRAQTLDDLMHDSRGGRGGFPDCVVRELQRLRDFDGQTSDQLSGPPWWRAMVKSVRN